MLSPAVIQLMAMHGTTPNIDYLRGLHALSSLDQAIEAVAHAHGLPHLSSETDLGLLACGNIEMSLRAHRPGILNVLNAPSGISDHSVIAFDLVGGNLIVADTDYPGQVYTWSEWAAKRNTATVTFLMPTLPQ